MPFAHLGLFATVPGLILGQIAIGIPMYFLIAGVSYYYFFIARKKHYFGDQKIHIDPAEIKKAMRLSVWNVIGNAIFATPLHYLVLHGHSKLYFSVAERGWPYFFFSAIVFLLITETAVYWAHRWLHHPLLYKWFHVYHHEYRRPHPWASMAFHPVDSFAQAVPHYLTVLILPVHVGLYLGFVVFLMFWTYFIHDRVTFVRLGVVNYTAHHTLHHIYNKYNFGQFLTIWDRLGGSYRDPKKETRFPVLNDPAASA